MEKFIRTRQKIWGVVSAFMQVAVLSFFVFIGKTQAQTITLTSQEKMWLDANSCSGTGPLGAWMSFTIQNTTGSTLNNVRVAFNGFTGTHASLFEAPADSIRTFSSIGVGETVPVYFYVDYSGVCGGTLTGRTANYSLRVTSTGNPAVVRNSSISTDELLSANAAGIALSSNISHSSIYVGQLFTQTVVYQYGNNTDLFMQPNCNDEFPDHQLRLVGSNVTATSGGVTNILGTINRLHYPTADVPGGGGTITVVYTWKVTGLNNPVTLRPWAAAKSGAKYKYAGLSASMIIPASSPGVLLSKTVTPSFMTSPTSDGGFGAGIVEWSVALNNQTSADLYVDRIIDTIPSCMTLSTVIAAGSDITLANSSSVPTLGISGHAEWVGKENASISLQEYKIPANTTYYLKYRTNVSGCPNPGSSQNKAYIKSGLLTTGPAVAYLSIGCPVPTISYPSVNYCPTGTASVTLTGTAGGTYSAVPAGLSINSSSGQIDLAASSPGNYTVTYTVITSCTTTATAMVNVRPKPAITFTESAVSCFGGSNGSLTASGSVATPPFSYSWSIIPVETTATITGKPAGSYTVTVTDAHGCVNSGSSSITQPSAALATTLDGQTNVACHGQLTGAIDIGVSGGTSPYTYSWTKDGNPFAPTTQDLTGLGSGTYVVTVTDANGCTTNRNVTITQPAAALATSLVGQTNVSCFGGTNGAIDINVTGGTSPYTYVWTKNSAPFAPTTQDLTGLGEGTYAVTVTDNNGCTATRSVTITQPAAALATSLVSQTNVSCFGGTNGAIDINVTGGTTSYSYSWTKNGSPIAPLTQDLSSIGAGTYQVTVTDANGCTATRSVTITEPAASLASSLTSQTNVSCFGGTNGAIDITVSNGTSPYTYSWTKDGNPFAPTTQDLTGLSSGTYVVTVTDANGCTTSRSVTITQPAAALATSLVGQTNVSCFGGTNGAIDINVTGGTSPYTYVWTKNSAPFAPTTQDLTGLGAGTYAVIVTDENGCTATRTITITEPTAISLSFDSIANVTCNGDANGGVFIIATGGTGAFGYLWNKQGNPLYSATSQNITPLSGGTYYLRVTDANGCIFRDTFIVNEPNVLEVTLNNLEHLDCDDLPTGLIDVNVAGGNTPYTYLWTKQGSISYAMTTQDIYNLYEGIYRLVVTDQKGCRDTLQDTVSSAMVMANFTATQLDCDGNYQLVNTSVGADSYVWDIQATTPIGQNQRIYCTTIDTVIIESFTQGTYTIKLTVNSNQGCVDSMVQTLTILPKPIAVFAYESVPCSNDISFINLTVNGVTSEWNFGDPASGINNTSTNNNPTHSFTALGSYSVRLIASDGAGCRDTVTRTIPVVNTGTLPVAGFTYTVQTGSCVTRVLFNNTSTNAASYLWLFHDGSSTNLASPSKAYPLAGIYTVTLISFSGSGCSDTTEQTIIIGSNTNGAIARFAINDSVQCLSNNRFNFINQSLYYGPSWISDYQWDFGDGTSNMSNTFVYDKVYDSAGIYNVRLIAISPSGCRDTAYRTVRVLPEADPTFIMTIGCGMVARLEHNIDTNAVYVWSFGDGNFSANNLDSFTHTYATHGWYNIQLTTYLANGCSTQYSIGTLASDGRSPIADFGYYIACANNVQFINLSQWAGSFIWDFGDGSPLDSSYAPYHSYPAAGNYTVTLIAYNSPTCIDTFRFTITAPQGMGVKLPVAHMAFRIQPCTNIITAWDSSSTHATNFKWYLNGTLVATGDSVNISDPGVGIYQLMMIADNGVCADTAYGGFEIQPKPTASFDMVSNTCSNTILVTSNSANANNYEWNFGEPSSMTNVAYGASAAHTYATNGTFEVRLIAFNLTGCADTAVQNVVLNQANSMNLANFTYQNALCHCVCKNTVKFTNLTPGIGNTFLWNFGDGSSSVQRNPSKGFPAAGTYIVTLTSIDINGCMSTKAMSVTIDNSVFGPSARFSTDHQVQCVDSNSFNFYNHSVFKGSGWINKYYWYFGDGTFDSTNSFIYNKHYTNPGNYVVTLVAVSTEGCRDTMSMYVQVRSLPCTGVLKYIDLTDGTNWNIDPMLGGVVVNGIANLNNEIEVSLYPNPNNGSFNFKVITTEDNLELSVLDITGRTVANLGKYNNLYKGVEIDVPELANGVYFIQVSNSETQLVKKKFVITR